MVRARARTQSDCDPDLSAVYGTLTMATPAPARGPPPAPPKLPSRVLSTELPSTGHTNRRPAQALAFVHVLLMAHGLICIKSMMAALALFRQMKFALNCWLNICQSHCWAFNNQFWALPCTLFATQIVFVFGSLKICLSNLFGVPL